MYERFNTYSGTRPRLRKTAGWSLVVLGSVAIVAPIIPGIPVLLVGFELLDLRHTLVEKIKNVFTSS